MRVLIIDSEDKRKRLIAGLAKFPIVPPIQVTIEEYDPKRSTQANRRYWLVIGAIAKETGNDKDEVHEFFKQKFLGERVVEIAGERATVRPSTTRLKKHEFNDYMEKVEAWGIEHAGVWLE